MRVTLREVRDEDLPLFYEQHRDPVAVAMAITPVRERDEFIARWLKNLADPANLTVTIEADGAVAGHACCFPNEGRRWVGYWVDRALWGKGIASAALRLLLEREPTRPLFAETADTNVRSQLVLRNAGFIEVGREPGSVTWRLG
ncbi:MAG: GNAT family N-acetyltransferase [Elusimicrobiota bacterium]|nr:GNAT family N-acetyltransferase [Elusimicrobiota bacterium]